MNSSLRRAVVSALAIMLLGGCSAKSVSERSGTRTHEVFALAGYFPSIGPAIDVPLTPSNTVEIQLPRLVSVGYVPVESPIQLSRDGDRIWVRSSTDDVGVGSTFAVRTVDAKEYRFRIVQAGAADSRMIEIRDPNTPETSTAARAQLRFESPSVTASDEATELMKILRNERQAPLPGYARLGGRENRTYLDTPQMRAVTTKVLQGPRYTAYALEVSNRTDSILHVRREPFLRDNVSLVVVGTDTLPASRPKFQLQKTSAEEPTSTVYVVERR